MRGLLVFYFWLITGPSFISRCLAGFFWERENCFWLWNEPVTWSLLRELILKLTVLWTFEQIHEIGIMISVSLMHVCVMYDTDMVTGHANRYM